MIYLKKLCLMFSESTISIKKNCKNHKIERNKKKFSNCLLLKNFFKTYMENIASENSIIENKKIILK